MRLDFNIILVDDDLHDEDNNASLLELERRLAEKIVSKGFFPVIRKYADANSAIMVGDKRVDLYLSDNNLGDNAQQAKVGTAASSGIELYFNLSSRFICDFVLYTRSDNAEIVRALSRKLEEEKNPNLFTRFTFVSRNGAQDWYQSIMDLIDHILTKREEINNLRGLYAQQTAIIHNILRAMIGDKNKDVTFNNAIDAACKLQKNNIPLISLELRRFLFNQKDIRNGVIHNDEKFCTVRNLYYIEYDTKGKTHKLYENDFHTLRTQLSNTVNLVRAI